MGMIEILMNGDQSTPIVIDHGEVSSP